MKNRRIRRLKAQSLQFYRRLWQRRSFAFRLSLAWALAASFAYFNQEWNADDRFAMRPTQKISNNIILVEIDRKNWNKILTENSADFIFREPNPNNDSYFWHEPTWKKLLKNILKYNPQGVGVALHFGEDATLPSIGARKHPAFSNNKVIWGVKHNSDGQILPSYFAGSFTKKAGLIDVQTDSDGMARRVKAAVSKVPLMPFQLLNKSPENNNEDYLINFRGPKGTFASLDAIDLLNKDLPKSLIEGKFVIVGPANAEAFLVHTPVGNLTRAEYLANVFDNAQNNRWIKEIPFSILLLLLAVLAGFSAWVISNYPQILASAVILLSLILSIAGSYLLFDSFYLYLPILPVSIALLGTYFIFLSFQLSLRDYENLQLEKEKEFITNVEELKTNFFSLISHDLKTPLAKIQGICDRMLSNDPKEEVKDDILALKQEARELNRYIKTLLHLTKVESKDFRVNKEPLDINISIEQVIELVLPLAKQKNITLKTELEPMFLIDADPLLITEVILNLVENAVKYSPENTNVSISSKEVDGRVIVIIEDQGPGININDQKHIFDKFYRGAEGKNTSKGSGLGLYLVRYFIEKHDGFVLLESVENKGTKIGFSVPAQSDIQDINEGENETSA